MNGQLTKMGVYYECVKCGYSTKIRIHMKNHCYKKNLCEWKNIDDKDKYKSTIEIIQESIKKRYKDTNQVYNDYTKIQDEKIDVKPSSNTIDPYIVKCLSKKNPKKKEYNCDFCKKVFDRKFNRNVHQSSCKIKKSVEVKENDTNPMEKDSENEEIISKVSDVLITPGSSRELSDNGFERENVFIPLLGRFFDAVDISHILEEKHMHNMLYLSYEKIFTEIMRNERNNNFYVSLESSEMIIYKDEINDVKKIPVEKGYMRICMNIHEYLMNQIKKLKMNPDYDEDDDQNCVNAMEKHIHKINKKYCLNEEYKNKFLTHIREFCREKKSIIFARFTQNFIANQEHRNQ